VSIVILGITLYYGLDFCLDYALVVIDQPEKKKEALKILTPEVFTFSQILLALLVIALSFLFFKTNTLSPYIQKAINYFLVALKNVFGELKSSTTIFVLIIPFLASVYYAVILPVSYDEAYTYIYMVSKPFYISALFYQVPNNHILYSLSANLTEHIPFLSVLLCLRLPSIIFSFMASLVGFSFVKKYYGKRMAMFVIALFPVLFMSVYYSCMARGYSLQVLLFIIVLYSAFNILEKNRKKDWMFFIVGSVLGFYTIPSFLYPFITINTIILILNISLIKKLIAYNFITLLLTLLLYTPVIIFNGIKALVNNKFVSPDKMTRLETLQAIPSFLYQTLEEISGVPGFVLLLICVVTFLLLLKNKDKKGIVLWAVFMLSPFIILATHNVIPFPRTFVYYGFVIIFLFALLINKYIDKIKDQYLLITVLIIQITAVYNFDHKIKQYELFSFESKKMSNLILNEESTYYMDDNALCAINHWFEMQTRGYDIKKNIFIDKTEGISADTIYNYSYIIISTKGDETKNKKPFYSNTWQNVYKDK